MSYPITKGTIRNVAVLAATDFYADVLLPSYPPCVWRIYISLSVAGVLSVRRTLGGTTVTENLNDGQVLTADCAYMFDILVDVGENINFRTSVGATILKMTVWEVVNGIFAPQGALTSGGVLNPHPVSLATLLNPHPVSLASIPNPSNLDVALSTRAIGAILNPHPVSLSTLLNPHPVSLASIPNPPNLDVALSLIKAKTDNLDVLLSTRFKPTDSIGNTSFGATQSARTSLKVQPEREDVLAKSFDLTVGTTSLLAAVASQYHKVYGWDYEADTDGANEFSSTVSAATCKFARKITKGIHAMTLIHPIICDVNTALSFISAGNTKLSLRYKTEA